MYDENPAGIIPPEPPLPPETGLPPVEAVGAASTSRQLLGYAADGQPFYDTPATSYLGSTQQSDGAEPRVPIRTIEAPRLVDISPSVVRQRTSPEEVKERHTASLTQYANLDLNDTEYVITDVPRHIIGLLIPILGGGILICLIIAGIISYPMIVSDLQADAAPNAGIIALVGIVVSAFIAALMYVSVWIYRANKLYLTNERIIQDIRLSLFSKRVQTISLGNIEDASYRQSGILQLTLNYGSIDLSTEGDEKAYQMSYVTNPRQQVATLTAAIEDFKNGREVDER